MKKKSLNLLVKLAMLSAVAVALMLFEFPLPFIAPPFYEIDFSEVPVLVGAFAFGPLAGAVIEGVKILLNLLINGTVTAGVGELSNFVLGVVFVLPAAWVYKKNRTKKGALYGLLTGTALLLVLGCFINAYVMLPAYGNAFGMPISAFVEMAAQIHPSIDTVLEFVLICVLPFNLIKAVLVSAITLLIYKKLSPILH
jgi:riboflavin transporter FmnP